MVNRLGEELGEQLVVKNLEAAAAGDLAHRGGVKAVLEITIAALDEDTAVAQTLCVDFPSDIIQV